MRIQAQNRIDKYRISSTLRRLILLVSLTVLAIFAETEGARTAKGGVVELGHGVTAILWREPADLASRNLLYGPGGEEHQPRGPFTFIQEDMEGTNPKLDVRDQNGVKWKVKLGAEARPEVAASRLVWAAGYFTPENYFLEHLRVEGLPSHLHRGQSLVAPDGTLSNVRLKRSTKGEEKLGTWQWGSNPFKDTREFNGLRVLMALTNNWDLKDSNNALYEEKHKESAELGQTYLVSDLGASFGTTGYTTSLDESRGNLESYKRSKFISKSTSEYVDFEAPGRPALIETVNLPVFLHRMDMRWIGRHIPRADAKWMGQLLGRLSPEQIRDAFRAAGYSSKEANDFAAVVEVRIAELNAL